MMKKLLLSLSVIFLTNCAVSNNPSTQNPSTSKPTVEGLIAYLPFSGKAEDESLSKSEVYLEGEVKLTADKNGKANSAYAFNNTNSYIEVKQDINPSKHKQLTMMAWIKPSNFNMESDIKTIISNDDGEFDRTLVLDHRGEVHGISAFSGDCEVFGVSPVELDKWTFSAITYDQDKKTIEVYVNDKKFSKTGCTIGESQNKFFRVGVNPGFTEPFDGSIDEVRIYNRVLSEQEINTIYKSY